ncbi:KEOPS complex subunit Pcc1 [Salinibaculum rarum]|uniref:KEOPS complex subunit Pcc1 n=1 Tax=Salinibaculum rarum TaxID=3058903 RepID=UPI00265D655A|nr:KEOPS complex subunit Pcc1 [Salinibaculum sp. KK48]
MRRATIRTTHGDGETARALARAVEPDNTDEMDTQVIDETVETTIARETTGGLHSTVDDYVVNLTVAAQLTDQQTPDNNHE